ncbi:TRAP transporter substrate-binding protein [Salinarimonas rosea]|uniref:TRAP transporter substrate-binding protein n=1 Tax=Salinarimonas rosea TaxID=552063 RepID=UPI000427B0AE|nr:TRAP transporter substrate-binding protein [Salinarimonas rosea]
MTTKRGVLSLGAATAIALTMLPAGGALAQTVLKLGHVWPPTEIQAQAAQQFAEDVREATGGEVEVQIFGGSTLGTDRELIEGLKLGTADIWVGGAGVLSAASDTAKIFTVPFMFDDLEHFQEVYNGPVGEEISLNIEEEAGYEVLSYWMRGPRWLTVNEEVQTPEDLAGLKIRVPDSPVFVKSWERLGAAPTPMAFGEVFTALQQGVIDGQENPLSLIYTAKFPEVVEYLVRTEHVMEPIAMVMSSNRFESLPEEHQTAVREAAQGRAKEYTAEQVLKGEKEYLQQLQEQGMTLVEPDAAAFQAQLEGFVDDEFPSLKPIHEKIRAAGGE